VKAHRVETSLCRRARFPLAVAGTLVCAHLGFCLPCRADFSSANFKRVWFEEFGSGLLPHAQPQVAVSPQSHPNAAALTQQPHPAVARIVVPEGGAMSFGSGTLVDVRDGYGIVVTNCHVVRDARGPIEVIFPGGFTSKARILKVDADWDLAALVIWQPPVDPVKIATTAPQPGDPLTICGYGPGIYRSATGRCTQYYAPREDFPQQMVELNVEARQGDSGGPIFNSRGELAGVLFGAGQGTTLGSFNGRVDQFLTSLAPDIGNQKDVQSFETPNQMEQIAEVPKKPVADTWRSSMAQQVDTDVKPASNSLLEPPAFEKLEQVEVERTTHHATFASAEPVTLPATLGQSLLFEKFKTGLAAFGLFSLALMLLKAAG
jgi:hypothetical protein